MKINYKNIKRSLTNYRWYCAMLWTIFVIFPFWHIPLVILLMTVKSLEWISFKLHRLGYLIIDYTESRIYAPVRWYKDSLPKPVALPMIIKKDYLKD